MKLGYAGSTVRLPLWPSPPKGPEEIVMEMHKAGLAGEKVYVPKVWRGYGIPDWKREEELKKIREAREARVHSKFPDWVKESISLRKDGYSLREIAKRVGKSREAVRKALKKLGID